MTTVTEIDMRCALCGLLSRKAVLTSTSSFGPLDLDLRPQEPRGRRFSSKCSAAMGAATAPRRSARRQPSGEQRPRS